MKRFRLVGILLLLVNLAGCGGVGQHEITQAQFTDQEFIYLQAVTEDALVFELGEGEYKATLYCYSNENWSNAGTLGPFNGGGNMLFATQMHPESGQRQPDVWVLNVDGMTASGPMQWEAKEYSSGKMNSYLAPTLKMEPGIEYAVAECSFTNEEEFSGTGVEFGGEFNMETADMSGCDYAWVLTVSVVQ